MIVEFLGISGSGKSFVATQYCHYLDDKGVNYIWPWKSIYTNGYIQRNLKKSIVVIKKIIASPRWCLKLLRFLMHQGINGKRDLPVLFFNGIYLCHSFEKYGSFAGVVLFDEGVAQYIWAIHFRNRRDVKDNELEEIRCLFNLPHTLYVVTADSDTILKRMVERNVRDEIRERGDAVTELENGQRMVKMLSHAFFREMGKNVIFIDNNDNGVRDYKHLFKKSLIVSVCK